MGNDLSESLLIFMSPGPRLLISGRGVKRIVL